MVKQARLERRAVAWHDTLFRRAAQRLAVLAVTAACLALALRPGPAVAEKLRILHTNDMHAHLEPFVNKAGEFRGGFARLATLANRERAGADWSLLLNAGDSFQGTPYYNFFHGEAEIRCMSLMGFDAMAVGNHEFDDGPVNLLRQVGAFADFPIVCANITVPVWMVERAAMAATGPELPPPIASDAPPEAPDAPRQGLGPPFIVRDFGPLQVAIVGVTTENLPQIVARRNLEGVDVAPVEATLRRVVPEARKRADLVVVTSHCGLQVDSLLARRVPGIDVIVGSHDHQALHQPVLIPNPKARNGLGGVLLVEAGSWAEYLGRLDLDVDLPSGRIAAWSGELLPVTDDLEESPAVSALVRRYKAELDPLVNEIIGQCPVAMPNDSVLVTETALGNWVADRMREAAHTDIAFQNGGGIRSNLAAGPVRVADIYKVLPFENTLVTMKLDGRRVQALCQEAVGLRASGGFCQVSGLRYRITSDGRVRDVQIGGVPLDPNRIYTLVTNNFSAAGGDGYTIFQQAKDVQDTGWKLRDMVIAVVRRDGRVSGQVEGRVVIEP